MPKFQPFPGSGMIEAELLGIKGDLAGVFQGRILSFPYQGHSPAGKLDPDLMGPSGVKPDLHIAQAFDGGQNTVG